MCPWPKQIWLLYSVSMATVSCSRRFLRETMSMSCRAATVQGRTLNRQRWSTLPRRRQVHSSTEIASTLASLEDMERCTQISSHPFHKTNKPGILSIDIVCSKDIIGTGGVDGNAVLFDRPSGQILSTLTGHLKKVTSVKFAHDGEFFLTGSADKTVRVWQASSDGNYSCKHILKDHTAEVQAVTMHATNNFFVTASLENTWCFYDLSSGTCLDQVTGSSEPSVGFTSAAFHPDGLIIGTGTSGSLVKIWDVKSQVYSLSNLVFYLFAIMIFSLFPFCYGF